MFFTYVWSVERVKFTMPIRNTPILILNICNFSFCYCLDLYEYWLFLLEIQQKNHPLFMLLCVRFALVVSNRRYGLRYVLGLLQCIPNQYVQWIPPNLDPNHVHTKACVSTFWSYPTCVSELPYSTGIKYLIRPPTLVAILKVI